ncbi:salicylate hydroxylase [Apiospora arundinis]
MSWAAGRKASVVEDRAYSLFGLFNVNLPMLYGERENAFLRLQEEIIKTDDGHSIFAWVSVGELNGGLLATTPEDFAGCGNVKTKWS